LRGGTLAMAELGRVVVGSQGRRRKRSERARSCLGLAKSAARLGAVIDAWEPETKTTSSQGVMVGQGQR
jgi:hypothetical protein